MDLLNTYLNKCGALVRDIILLTDPSEIKSVQNELSEVNAKIDAALVEVKNECRTEKELPYINVIEQELPDYRDLSNQVVALGLQNENDKAMQKFKDQAQPSLNEIITAAEDLMTLNIQMGNEVSDNLTRQSRIMTAFIIGLIVAAFIVSVLLAMYIANSIARPLIKVKDAAAQLAEGNLNIQISAESGNEVGQMTESFANAAAMTRHYITELSRGLHEISQGNFDVRTSVVFKGNFQEMRMPLKLSFAH